jgi:hypothetical protein
MDVQQARAQAILAHPEMNDEEIAALTTRLSATPYQRAQAELRAAIAREELAEAKAYEQRVKAGAPTAEQILKEAQALGKSWAGESGRDFLSADVLRTEYSRPHTPIEDDPRSVVRRKEH